MIHSEDRWVFAQVCARNGRKTAIIADIVADASYLTKRREKIETGREVKRKISSEEREGEKNDTYIDVFGSIEHIVCFVLLSHIEMNPAYTERSTESAPLRSDARPTNYLSVSAAGQTFGTPYFLMCVPFSLDLIETERKTRDQTTFLVRR